MNDERRFVTQGEQAMLEEQARVDLVRAFARAGGDAAKTLLELTNVFGRHGEEATTNAFASLFRQMARK